VKEDRKRILLVTPHNAFRESLARRLSQESDLEVVWQAATVADTRNVHLDGINVAIIDPVLPDGNGMALIREVSAANPNALALVLSHQLDSAMRSQAVGAGAAEVLSTAAPVEDFISVVRRTGMSRTDREGRRK
jgi:two-component system response regulator DevR